MSFIIKELYNDLIESLVRSFSEDNIVGSENYYSKCLQEQNNGERIIYVALENEIPVGAVHLLFKSKYKPFFSNNTPEINDLNVISTRRKRGIGTSLIKACETYAINNRYSKIGLGVGLYKDYGNAQRLYFNMRYKPDGLGLMYNYNEVKPGTHIFVDDDLNIYYVKDLIDS